MLYWNNQHSGPKTELYHASARLCLTVNNLRSHLSWKLSQTPSHRLLTLFNNFFKMVSIISINMNKTELPATKGFTIVHCRLWNINHASCFTGATLITQRIATFLISAILKEEALIIIIIIIIIFFNSFKTLFTIPVDLKSAEFSLGRVNLTKKNLFEFKTIHFNKKKLSASKIQKIKNNNNNKK